MNPLAYTANKAWLAAVVAAAASFVATVQGRTDLDTMKSADWVIVVLSALVAGATVYMVPNKKSITEPEATEVEEASQNDVDLREE